MAMAKINHRSIAICFILCLVCLHSHAQINNQLLTESALLQQVTGELDFVFKNQNRLNRLPNNIQSIALSPALDPIFTLQPLNPPSPTNLSLAISSLAENKGGFRIVRGGRVMAVAQDEVVLGGAFSNNWNLFAIVSPTNIQELKFWVTANAHEPFIAGSDWGFHVSGGMKLYASTNMKADLPDVSASSLIIQHHEKTLFFVKTNHYRGPGFPNPMDIVTREKDRLSTRTFPNSPGAPPLGAVQVNDGNWILINQKLSLLTTNFTEQATDGDLQDLLFSYQSKNASEFNSLLQRITQAGGNPLNSFVTLISQLDDPNNRVRDLQLSTRDALQKLSLRKPDPLMPADAQKTAELLISKYRNQCEQFLSRLQESQTGPIGISIQELSEASRGGFQYFNGKWILRPRLLQQNGLDSAIIVAITLDKAFKRSFGIFKLDSTARLQPIASYPIKLDPGSVSATGNLNELFPPEFQYFTNSSGDEFWFVPNEGFSQIKNGKLEPLVTPSEFRFMNRCLGLDNKGRFYFSSTGGKPSRNRNNDQERLDYWVYQPSRPLRNDEKALLFPITGVPVADSENRVWFLSILPAQPKNLEPELARAIQQIQAANVLPTKIHDFTGTPEDARFIPFADLYYFEGTNLFRVATNLHSAVSLYPGRSGSILGISTGSMLPDGLIPPQAGKKLGAFLVSGNDLYKEATLHELAVSKPELLATLAPSISRPRPNFPNSDYLITSKPSFALQGDILWVNQHNLVEGYRNGKPLGVAPRLAVLNPPSGIRHLFGPLPTTNGYAMALAWEREGAPLLFLITTNGDKIGLDRFAYETPPNPRVPGNPFQYAISAPRDFKALLNAPFPLLDQKNWSLYFSYGPEKAIKLTGLQKWQPLDNSGSPQLILENGDLIVSRAKTSVRGYRLCRDDQRIDIVPSYARPFKILGKGADGKLLGAESNRLTLLAPDASGNYIIEREMEIDLGGEPFNLVTETATDYFLTVIDQEEQPWLAVIHKNFKTRSGHD
ncbi:MAG: hypothetical protein JWM04_947 [Verrucomicrobiales bacterium]|nr:hypothetical protein [Verrucomicrobiales bacterium]